MRFFAFFALFFSEMVKNALKMRKKHNKQVDIRAETLYNYTQRLYDLKYNKEGGAIPA